MRFPETPFADLLSFLIAFLVCAVLVPALRRFAVELDLLDRPAPRKIHSVPMPLLGGLAIYFAASLVLVLFVERREVTEALAIMSGAGLLLVVGILDDLGYLWALFKLLAAMPLAAVLIAVTGIRAAHPVSLLLDGSSPLTVAAVIVATCLWIVAVTAAFNILDHMDGLCAGVSAIAGLFFFVFAELNGQTLVSLLAAAIAGAAAGYLYWNFHPAEIFMGDGGAMFFGFLLAVLAIKVRFPEHPPSKTWMIPVLILLAPLFDAVLVTVSRARRGRIPFTSPGKDHFAHRLARLGLGQRGAVLGVYAVGILGGVLSVAVTRLPVDWCYGLMGGVACAAVIGIGVLERVPLEGPVAGNS